MLFRKRALLVLGSAVMALGLFAGSASAQVGTGSVTWSQAKRLIQFAPPAEPSLPYGVPPTRVGQCWDTILSNYEIDPRTGAARVTGKYPGRECIAEPVPYMSRYLRFQPQAYQDLYNAAIANINGRLEYCAATEGTWFPGIIRPEIRTPESGPRWTQIIRATNTHAIGSAWTECLKNKAPGDPEIVFVRDEPGTPQMDYDVAVPVSAHAKYVPRSSGPLVRDRWMSDYVSELMGHPTHDQLAAAYGDPFAMDRLFSEGRMSNGMAAVPNDGQEVAVVDHLLNSAATLG